MKIKIKIKYIKNANNIRVNKLAKYKKLLLFQAYENICASCDLICKRAVTLV